MSQARRAFARIGGAQPRRALAHAALAAAAGAASWLLLRRDRWRAIRCHPWAVVRWQYKRFAIYGFARRLDAAFAGLHKPGGAPLDDDLLARATQAARERAPQLRAALLAS